ncbi:MAG: NADH-quinone oxidoreductase subunit C [Peptococcaceae bacterium]|nr:NADH-quinone oxidoreductase subunit C [Peptococcaceae bacterium]
MTPQAYDLKWEKLLAMIRTSIGVAVTPLPSYPGELHLAIGRENIPQLAGKFVHAWSFELVQLLANDERVIDGDFKLYYTFAGKEDQLVIVQTSIAEDDLTFPSISASIPAADWYEREVRDLFGIEPVNHPSAERLAVHADWPEKVYAMRRDFNLDTVVPRLDQQFSFKQVKGEGVMEIPVGPIHAGIIEPGHFRFSAVGDKVINLEARLFYAHRGMEKLCEGKTPEQGLLVAERICGACSCAHSTAYCQAVEKISHTSLPPRAEFIRTIALELERLYNHVGDVGNICAGVGFAFGTMYGARLKENILRLNELVFGSRFLRGINIPGGVRRDIDAVNACRINEALEETAREFNEFTAILLSTESFLDRVKKTGILSKQIAADLHAVGPAARASGINRDSRRDHPYAAYRLVSFRVPVYKQGDVLDRVNLRIDESAESIGIIKQALRQLPAGELRTPLNDLAPFSYALGVTESPRGENVHFVMSGSDNTILRHMVRSASYCNWQVLPSTVPGNIVPDFPLINKSFELCYACLDR